MVKKTVGNGKGKDADDLRILADQLCNVIVANRENELCTEFHNEQKENLTRLRLSNHAEYIKRITTFSKCFAYWKKNDERYILTDDYKHLEGIVKTM
jgi:hypothetical protein